MEGGIKAWQGLVATGGFEAGTFLIDGLEDPAEMLAVAWRLEDRTGEFYRAVMRMFSEDEAARTAFEALARAEETHKERVLESYRLLRPEQAAALRDPGSYMEGGVLVDEAVEWLEASGRKIEEVLEASMQLETNALDFYMKLSDRTVDDGVRSALAGIVREEKAHLTRLAALLETFVRP